MENTTIKTFAFALFAFCLLLPSCITKQQYAAMESSKNRYKRKADSLRNLQKEYRYTDDDLARFEQKVVTAKKETQAMRTQYQTQVAYADDLERRYNELLEQNNLLLNASSSEVQDLTNQAASCRVALDEKDRTIGRLQQAIAGLQVDLEGATNTPAENCDEYRRQVAELNTLLRNNEDALFNLKTKVNKALLGFSDSDLAISELNGKVYVSLSQELLFASGSDHIDWKGKSALKKLAEVLKTNDDISIIVEGHTDSDGSAASNWDLSVRRATAVVNVLSANGVDPKNVTAAGRALYEPIAPNNTATGKAKNRRTEIILTPNLNDLYQLLNQ